MREEIKRREILILNVLKKLGGKGSSSYLSEHLANMGYRLSERTVRFYLKRMEELGLTEKDGKRGYRITERGIMETEVSRIIEKVGFLSSRIDQMAYNMTFDLNSLKGTVVVNVTIADPKEFKSRVSLVEEVFKRGYTMGKLLTFFKPGEKIGSISIPEGMIGIGTVCSISLNGVLLKHGIPCVSRFGGLLEIRNGKPSRFLEVIMYDGTTLDPLEIFVKGRMTDFMGAIRTGSGKIGASFREFPSDSRQEVREISHRMEKIGLGGFLLMGVPGHSLLEIPVFEGRFGAIVVGGLNAVSILEETGAKTVSKALAGLVDFERLFPFQEMKIRLEEVEKGF